MFRDPEGPNLLVVMAMALVIYLVSLVAYLSNVCPTMTGLKRGLAAVAVQVLVASGFYLGLR